MPTCPECGHTCPARMQSCTACLALLRPAEVDLGPDIARVVAAGLRLPQAIETRWTTRSGPSVG